MRRFRIRIRGHLAFPEYVIYTRSDVGARRISESTAQSLSHAREHRSGNV